jgi:putative ABC transport system ATP-binding protein
MQQINGHDLLQRLIEADLKNDKLLQALTAAERRNYASGTDIIQQGDEADIFYVIVEGEVEVIKDRPDTGAQVIAHLKDGDYFGEIGLLYRIPRTATVRAISDVAALTLDRDTFTRIVSESDLTSKEMSAVIQQRLMMQ